MIKNRVIVILCASTAFFYTACGTESTKKVMNTSEHDEHSGEHTFACPMHPEVIGKEGEMCPKCGMELEHNDNAGKSNGLTYYMKFTSSPSALEVDKAGLLIFTPKIKGKENTPVPLEVVHEKKLHLIVASKDLSYFEHIHPEYQSDGSYQIKVLPKGRAYTIDKGQNETRFEQGGDYMLFADYAPSGSTHQLEKIPLTVNGSPYKNKIFTTEALVSNVDGYTVSLEVEGKNWLSNYPMHIKAVIKKGNKVLDANTFEDYLGAKSHMVVLKTETFDYLHVHPSVEKGNLDLHTTFETEGTYRGWLQFQIDGKVHTADFVIKVAEREMPAESEGHPTHIH